MSYTVAATLELLAELEAARAGEAAALEDLGKCATVDSIRGMLEEVLTAGHRAGIDEEKSRWVLRIALARAAADQLDDDASKVLDIVEGRA